MSDFDILHEFKNIEDPRREHNRLHNLCDILFIAICSIVANAESYVEIETFGKIKENFFKQFLELPHGIPSHDTFGRVFRLIDPQILKEHFRNWVKSIVKKIDGEVIAIDGKTVRRSFDKVNAKSAIHVVSAWASENRIVLGQRKVDEKSNEITAIPELITILDIENCIITIDAMGTQKNIARVIVDNKGDYVLALKENHKNLHEDVKEIFQEPENISKMKINYDYHKTVEKAHGRIEKRECYVTSDIKWLADKKAWKGLQSIVMVKSTRTIDEQTSIESRYYLSSLKPDAEKTLKVTRSHWSVENSLHWVLDIGFREDECRIRKDHAPENFNLMRHLALNLLKQDTSKKMGIKAKRKNAGWDNDFLLKILVTI